MLETVVNLCRVMAVAASVVGSISSIVFAQGKLSDVDAIRFQGGTQHAIPVEQQLVVEVSLKDVNVQVRAFRARQADLKTGWACDDTKDGCVICDSVVIFPQGGNWKLEFPKFDLSWLRPDGPDRVGDGVTFLRLEPVGFRPDGPIKLKRSELEAYFRFGVEVVLKVPGSMSGVNAKELNERIQGLFDLRGRNIFCRARRRLVRRWWPSCTIGEKLSWRRVVASGPGRFFNAFPEGVGVPLAFLKKEVCWE